MSPSALKPQPVGQPYPSRWLEPSLLLQIAAANLSAGGSKKRKKQRRAETVINLRQFLCVTT